MSSMSMTKSLRFIDMGNWLYLRQGHVVALIVESGVDFVTENSDVILPEHSAANRKFW